MSAEEDEVAGGSRPAEAVHNFLGRPGPRRSDRTLADHLAPRPVPAATPSPAPRPAPAPPPPRPAATAAPPPATAPPPAAVGTARTSERLVVLDDDTPSWRVPTAERGTGTLRVQLEWEPLVTASGLQRSTDLHLGCLWETRDRRNGLVQSQGELLAAPGYGARQVLRLGARGAQGEELLVDTRHLDLLRRVVLYLYTTRSAPPGYPELAPHVTLRRRDGARLQAWATGAPAGARTCALLSVHDVGGELVVRRENEYFTGPQREVAEAYGFDDLTWGPDGTVPLHA
ncbi:hypothetical protein MO973_35440 [Paenibacillus sp. TRM 82003]|uniref:hypothetical protein n=1 Tax=Kineococcus sp. TRM81007 TaxID=2925831 RepID=UPI001F59BF53|nr:hypothetical protein [Kineococcus sp. TRM81007]MCI2240180.1 hypothetical protein [Kineococcus sp. TRM81007]MCI3925511.1 hypothetical protein [Paenibacillus sp. TRM 82003]